MSNSYIYKTEAGQYAVEGYYLDLLAKAETSAFESFYCWPAGIQTHVLAGGPPDAPVLICLHGTASNSASWLGALPLFEKAFRVYCVDIPGEPGLSQPFRCSVQSDDPFLWMDALIELLSPRPVHLVTISLGSWYALHYAVRRPERVAALSMLTSPGLTAARIGFLFKAVGCMMLGRWGQHYLNKTLFYKTAIPVEMLGFQTLVNRYFKPMTEPIPLFKEEELTRLQLPIQYFGGDHDALLNTQQSAHCLRTLLPHAEVSILPETGHVILNQFEAIHAFQTRAMGK